MQDYFSNLLRVFCLVEKRKEKMEGNGLNKEEKTTSDWSTYHPTFYRVFVFQEKVQSFVRVSGEVINVARKN